MGARCSQKLADEFENGCIPTHCSAQTCDNLTSLTFWSFVLHVFTCLPDVQRNRLAVLQLSTQVGSLETLSTDAGALVAQRLLHAARRYTGTSVNVGHRLLLIRTRTCGTQALL